MAYDIFLKIDGIPGESTDDKHKDEIEILSYGFGVSQPISGTVSSSGSMSASKADFTDISFMHSYDIASPKLFESCSTGKHIPSAVLSLHRATGNKEKYLEIKLSDVLVSSVQISGSGGGDDVPTESFTLAFGKVEITYTKLGTDGKAAGNASAGWDRIKNVKI